MSFLDRIREANTGLGQPYHPFVFEGREMGRILPRAFAELLGYPEVFRRRGEALHLAPGLEAPQAGIEKRTEAIAEVTADLHRRGLVPGWRDELFAIQREFGETPCCLLERAALPLFGVRGFGVHVNGYTRTEAGTIEMWIGRRAADKPTWPGLLDQMVAGGQPAGLGVFENVLKECAEEAGIEAALARRAVATGALTYCYDYAPGLRPDVVFTFDLELPPGFTPLNRDGEVQSFERWTLAEVARTVRETRDFKFNCALVALDFLIRHGHVSPEEPGYVDLIRELRVNPFRD